jgi:membrane peptidoglycan carboxypeptidase
MQTSLARRQRHRRTGAARRPRGGGAAKGVALAIPLFFFSTFILVGTLAFLTFVTAYAFYSRDLPDPKTLLTNLRLEEQTIVYDRTGKVELARLGSLRRELARFEEIPPVLLDATTSIEDKDFWSNPGFDLGGFISASLDTLNGRPRGGSTITQQLVRNRLLPDELQEGEVWERKIREIIQSVRLTDEFPGEEGKRQIITAYLNENFYGSNSYGVKAAARTYFGVTLDKLTLAQAAILAGIPQSPSKFDLVQNAEERCLVEVAKDEECPADQLQLVVPADSEIVIRRNYILDRMAENSVLTKGDYRPADYAAAKAEPVVLANPRSTPWRAPHFVWQVREQLATILCPGQSVDDCPDVDTGGYRVTTTLDWSMQRTGEKWVFVAARAPNARDPRAVMDARKIPAADQQWVLALRGRNIHNAAAAVMDYRTGEVLAYVGSASYTARGNDKFDPQFDVLAQGWRQPGSAIKPLNYLVGIDDRTMTAATIFMDVVTDFGGGFTPTQADGLERGPVRLRSALQFSLNVPSIKAGIINGLEHTYERWREMGLSYHPDANPVTSMGIGTLDVHPIDLLGAYGAIANKGLLMPRTTILRVVDSDGDEVWSTESARPKGKQIASPQASYIVTDILAGNTDSRVNPYWAKWAVRDPELGRRPAAYKTGTTNDNRDVAAYGYLAPPDDPAAPALAVGVWMGNSNNDPNDGKLSLDTSAPLWSRILRDVSTGMPVAKFSNARPDGVVVAEIDAHSGLLPGPNTRATVRELFIDGTVPTRQDDTRIVIPIDSATGLRWQDGCTGPRVYRSFLDLSDYEAAYPEWQRYNRGWISRAARGPYTRGGPEGTRAIYFYDGAFHPFGTNWGGGFAPSGTCEPLPPSPPPPCDPLLGPCPSPDPGGPGGSGPPGGGPPEEPKPTKRPRRAVTPVRRRDRPSVPTSS